jgi:hypothetical protein
MVDDRAEDGHGLLALQLQDLGCEPVAHAGGFVGLRGRAVRRVPAALWDALDRHEAALARMLAKAPTPYRAPGRRHRQGPGAGKS